MTRSILIEGRDAIEIKALVDEVMELRSEMSVTEFNDFVEVIKMSLVQYASDLEYRKHARLAK